MGKQGPCCHCGVTSTPLWRNGPPDKPVLCNACGSRWRTKGTLANYTPLHARADPEFEDLGRISRVKCLTSYKKKEVNFQKRKRQNDNSTVEVAFLDHYQSFSGVINEDTSNRSSSGSAISNSESSTQFGSGDASDLTGPAQSIVWDTMVPSRKRTCTGRQKQTSVEKLTQDLYTIMHKQQLYFSGYSEDLIFETGKPLVSAEIVHGSVLMRNPSSIAREEESEASSLSIDNKLYSQNEAYSYIPNHRVHSENHNRNLKFFDPASEAMKCMDPVNRDNFPQEKLGLENNYSLQSDVDLSDVLNYEVFTRQLTNEEQRRLLEFLPPADATKFSDGLKQMFESQEYKENLNSFRQVLAEGCLEPRFKQECGFPNAAKSSRFVNPARSRDCQNRNFQDSKTTLRSSKEMMNMKANFENKEHLEDEGSCFSPRSLFALPPERSMLDNLNFAKECSDQDLLLDVRSSTSFPEAELLYPLNYGSQQASTSSSSGHQQFLLH